MRKLDLCVLSLSLLFTSWQTAARNPPAIQSLNPTEKVCHVCDDEEIKWQADSAPITPAHIVAVATPSPTDDCEACMLHGDRIRSLSTQVAREEATAENQGAVIHILLFWMQSCPHCHDVLKDVLPPLQQHYDDLLEILLIEIVTVDDVNELYQIAAEFGIPKENTKVPFLIIGDAVLIGSDEILTRLPRLIQDYLAEGGVDLPLVPGLDVFPEGLTTQRFTLNGEIEPSSSATDRPMALSAVEGAWLAIATLIGMMLALLYAAAIIYRIQRGMRIKPALPWLANAMPILALVGVAIAGYLTYVETHTISAVCGPVGDCNIVQSSPFAWVLGVMPVGLLGVLGYLAILAAWLWGRLRDDWLARLTPIVSFGMTLLGVLYAVYLTYLEPFVIGAVCLWCLASSVIITLLFLLSLRPMLQALATLKA